MTTSTAKYAAFGISKGDSVKVLQMSIEEMLFGLKHAGCEHTPRLKSIEPKDDGTGYIISFLAEEA